MKWDDAHVYAHEPNMHTNEWIQEASDKPKTDNNL